MRKIISLIIFVTFMSIAIAYPSALRPPMGQIEKERIEVAQAEAALRDKLGQMRIYVEEHGLVKGGTYFSIPQMKIITPEQFRLAVGRAKRILSEYTGFDVEYYDFVFVPEEEKRFCLRSLPDIRVSSAGARKSKTIDMGAKLAIESILQQAGISPETAATKGKPIVEYSGEFNSEAQNGSIGAIPILGNLAYDVTIDFEKGIKTVRVKGKFQKLEGRRISYNLEDTYEDVIEKDIADTAIRNVSLSGEQIITEKGNGFFNKRFEWILRILKPTRSAI